LTKERKNRKRGKKKSSPLVKKTHNIAELQRGKITETKRSKKEREKNNQFKG